MLLSDLPVYSGFNNCIRGIWKIEGVRGFYNGLTLALIKAVPSTTITLCVYGALSRL